MILRPQPTATMIRTTTLCASTSGAMQSVHGIVLHLDVQYTRGVFEYSKFYVQHGLRHRGK